MTDLNLSDLYFKWLVKTVGGPELSNYNKVLRFLFNTEFVAVMDRDDNRIQDGLDLRYYFSFETPYATSGMRIDINRPCSVLEVMVSLAVRCERDFMRDKDYDDRTDIWFFDMVRSMHLDELDDSHFDPAIANERVRNMLYRSYGSNGDGGLFTVSNPELDMPNSELWYQLCWYQHERGTIL